MRAIGSCASRRAADNIPHMTITWYVLQSQLLNDFYSFNMYESRQHISNVLLVVGN